MTDNDIETNIKAMNAGILPAFNSIEIDKLLETLDDKASRNMKRKFRKLWRKERRLMLNAAESQDEFERISLLFESPKMRRIIVKERIAKKSF